MKTNICHLTFDMRIGGTEQVIKNIIEGSNKELFNMSVFCIESPIGPFGKMLLESHILIESTQRKEGFDTSLILRIRKHIKKQSIHILHCHQYTPWVYGALACIGTKTKVVFTEHGRFYPDSSSLKRKIINPFLTFFTEKITAISQATQQALVDYEFIPKNKIEIIYNGISPFSIDKQKTLLLKRDLKIDDKTTVIGTIARLDPIKNHAMMFYAFKEVLKKFPDTVLILVGDGDERANLEKIVESLNITNHVIFTGYIPKPKQYLDCFEIFLLPSFSEGASMTLLEAMSLSKPCIVTNAGGNSEIIINGINGLVTENNNQQQYSAAVSTLLSNNHLLKSMQTKALNIFNSNFSSIKMCHNFHQLYISCASKIHHEN